MPGKSFYQAENKEKKLIYNFPRKKKTVVDRREEMIGIMFSAVIATADMTGIDIEILGGVFAELKDAIDITLGLYDEDYSERLGEGSETPEQLNQR